MYNTIVSLLANITLPFCQVFVFIIRNSPLFL
jgi:hypothetical protein